jgi:hypothetical protein
MHAQDRFLMEIYRRTAGRTDRTVHSHRHIAQPLALSDAEVRAYIAALIQQELIAVDPMYDRLIALTPRGAALCAPGSVDAFIRDLTADDPSDRLLTHPETHDPFTAPSVHEDLVVQ